MSDEAPKDFTEILNQAGADGWITANGLRLVRATVDEVVAEMPILPAHLQGYGIVHGGVHAAVVETLASIGAALSAFSQGKSVVGLENHTSFLRAVRSGTLHARATPLTRGRRTQVWEAAIRDDEGRLVATGRVRLLVLDAGTELGGERVGIREE